MDSDSMKFIAIGCMAIGMGLTALGVGNIFVSLLQGISRNPSAEEKMSRYALMGAGMAEAMGVFSLVVALILMFVI